MPTHANKWIEHLMKFRANHPSLSMTEAMEKAKKTYHKKKAGGAVRKRRVVRRTHRKRV